MSTALTNEDRLFLVDLQIHKKEQKKCFDLKISKMTDFNTITSMI